MKHSVIRTQLNGFKYRKTLNISIWPIDGTLTGITGVLHIPQTPHYQM